MRCVSPSGPDLPAKVGPTDVVEPREPPSVMGSRLALSDFHFSPRPNRAAQIRWREWGDKPFLESREEAKPILLAISAVWCHWCHVMDETTYSTDAVIDLINERFVPVRVDNDRRPDVNARYNMGGWPTTAVLTSDGEIVHGGTYIPPDAMHRLLHRIERFFAEPDNRLELAERVAEVKAERERRTRPPDAGPIERNTASQVFACLENRFDPDYGGFGDEQKFPQTSTLHFLMDAWSRSRDERAKAMVVKSLHGMAGGGMYDHVEGGFFRYSTTRDFSVPHFEKMLEDLGGLMFACARAASAFGDVDLRSAAIDVRRYLDTSLWQPAHQAYGGSQDADETYYTRDSAGRATLTAPYVDPTIYTSWNAETARALLLSGHLLFESASEADDWVRRGLHVLETLWHNSLDRGLMCRYFDGEPHLRGLLGDQVWSVAAALSAHAVTGESVWLERAGALIGATESLFDAEAGGYRDRLLGGEEPGRLSNASISFNDNALMAQALLSYAAVTGEESWDERARALLGRFHDEYRRYEVFAAGYGSAVLDALEPPIDVVIVGGTAVTSTLRAAALRVTSPALRVNPIDPSDANDGARFERLGYVPTSDAG
ncbi:MAG TPA: DUF255 domain-containing protein, partial [Candidatus Eremiobacteraceae bacterium]|nr:DUF255 domain-containing protein [Candidatus Eremiobacteraceae bacterium]